MGTYDILGIILLNILGWGGLYALRSIRDKMRRGKHIQILAEHRGYHGRWKVRLEYNSKTDLFTILREDEVASIAAARITNSHWDTFDKEEAFRIFETVKDMPQKEIGA